MKIVKNIIKGILETLSGNIISAILSLSFFSGLLHNFNTLIIKHPLIFEILFALSLTTIIFLTLNRHKLSLQLQKINKKSEKKIVNRIAVDKQGECYCPKCDTHLSIKTDVKYVGQKLFFCQKCKSEDYPWLKSATTVSAHSFYAFQQQYPQTVLTSELYRDWDNKEFMKRQAADAKRFLKIEEKTETEHKKVTNAF